MEKNEYFDSYEQKLSELLLEQCVSKGAIDDMLIMVDELDEKWIEMAPEYMVNAVPIVNEYPTVAVAWAGYLGMAVASIWDSSWDKYKDVKDLYSMICDARGFDEMDEYIVEDILGLKLDSKEAVDIENLFRSCAYSAIGMIRKENIQAMTGDAFHVFARTAKLFFKLGVSIELKRAGYKYAKVVVEQDKIEYVN